MKLTAGIHPDVPMAAYVADLLRKEPTASKGDLWRIVETSAAHAWQDHPRLNPEWCDSPSSRGDVGSAVHDVSLLGYDETKAAIVRTHDKKTGKVICPTDWKTVAARAARDKARAEGKIPILEKHAVQIHGMDRAASRLLEARGFERERVEHTILWKEEGVWCRTRPDIICGDYVIDLKTAESADPIVWTKRQMLSKGYHIQASHQKAGIYAIEKRNVEPLWLIVELKPPHAATLIGMQPELADFADRQRALGLKMWAACLESGHWPGYSTDTHWADLPVWAERDQDARVL